MAIKFKVKTKTNKSIERGIKDLTDGYVKIGWFKGKTEPNGMLSSEVAYLNDKGHNIIHKGRVVGYVPARPFMEITMAENQKRWNNFWKKAYQEVVKGKLRLKEALTKLGDIVRQDIKITIRSNVRPHNAKSTKRAKRAKGHPDITLIDSGTMLRNVDVESGVHK